jgi:serine/threonine protein kinase
MPYYERGTLAQWLLDNPENQNKQRDLIAIVYQIVQGVAFLHRSEIIHRDIKLENVYMKTDTQPIIADFDVSKDRTIISKSPTMLTGTTEYLAPELTSYPHEASTASDMWALGTLVYKVFFPNQPVPAAQTLAIPNHDNTDLRDFLEKLLKVTPTERLSAEEALVHPLFSHSSMVKELEQKV